MIHFTKGTFVNHVAIFKSSERVLEPNFNEGFFFEKLVLTCSAPFITRAVHEIEIIKVSKFSSL